jgi:hypothetical protein
LFVLKKENLHQEGWLEVEGFKTRIKNVFKRAEVWSPS